MISLNLLLFLVLPHTYYALRIIIQKFQSYSFRQASLYKVFQSDLLSLSNVKTKIPNTASESQIYGSTRGLRRNCHIEQQKNPGPVSRLYHVTARCPKDPLHQFLRYRQWCARRSNLLRRRGGLRVAKDSTTNAGFSRAALYSACDDDNGGAGARLVICNCSCNYYCAYYTIWDDGNNGDDDGDGDQKEDFQTETNPRAYIINNLATIDTCIDNSHGVSFLHGRDVKYSILQIL